MRRRLAVHLQLSLQQRRKWGERGIVVAWNVDEGATGRARLAIRACTTREWSAPTRRTSGASSMRQ